MRKHIAVACLIGGATLFAAPMAWAEGSPDVCPGDHVITKGEPMSVTVTAPEGSLISGYCVKAGSDTDYVTFEPPVASVEISDQDADHAVSHYSVVYVEVPDEPTPSTSTPSTEPAPSTSTVPSTPPSTPATTPVTTPTTPAPSTTTVKLQSRPSGSVGSDPAPSTTRVVQAAAPLPVTGTRSVVVTAICGLALIGGGAALLAGQRGTGKRAQR